MNILVRGQSNAQIMMDADGIAGQRALVQRVEQLLGFDGAQNRVQLVYGHPTADQTTVAPGTALLTDWLSPMNGDWRQGWNIGAQEAALLNFIHAQPATTRDNPTAVLWLHNEYDAIRGDVTAEMWSSALRFDAALVRQALGQRAATVPYVFVSAIPSSSAVDGSLQAIRLAMEGLAGDAAFNASIGARALDLDMSWDDMDGNPATLEYGGTHMSSSDALLVVERAARSIAEGWANYALPGSPLARANGNIANEGPEVVAAWRSGAAQLDVDFAFDAATTLVAWPVVGTGLGWSVRNPAGHAMTATGLTPVDGDTVRLHFAGPLPEGPLRLHYGWGYGRLAAGDSHAQGHALYDDQGLPAWTMAQGVGVARWEGGRTVLDYSDSALRPTLAQGLTSAMMAQADEVRFLDGRLVFDADDPAAVVLRLYQVALGRQPDAVGLNTWIGALAAGRSLEEIGWSFLTSAEFQARYGGLDHSKFVAQVYRNGLGREADADGHAMWVSQLAAGRSQAWVLGGFSESAESRGRTAGLLAQGLWDADEPAAQIARLYDTAFGRQPDAPGLAFHLATWHAGRALTDIAASFLQSPEFQARYGLPEDAGFVTALYHNSLHREPDAAGLAQWLWSLASGMSRADVVLGFSDSAEHVQQTAGLTMGTHPGEAGIVFA
nr:DUF4214 domain-containing protein [Pseudoroseomonas ludipueritiae]